MQKIAPLDCHNPFYDSAVNIQNELGYTRSENNSATGLGLAFEGPPPIAKPGPQLIKVLSLITYFKAELQRLLQICIYIKEPSNNKLRFTLKACFPNLYFGKSYLDCY